MSELRREQIGTFNLDNISDVSIATPSIGYGLVWNGSTWTPSPLSTISGSSGINFYLDDAHIIPRSTENLFELNTLSKTPITTTEQLDATTLTNTTSVVEAYLYNSALGKTVIEAGTWSLGTYAQINSTTGTGVAEIITSVKVVKTDPDVVRHVTTSGTGTTRLANTVGYAFVAGDANADQTLASYIQTPKGVFQIVSFISPNNFNIAVPTGYNNENDVSFSVCKHAFNITTGAITTTALTLYQPNYAETAVSLAITDKLCVIYFAKSTYTISKTITFSHNGNTRYSYLRVPIPTYHNELSNVGLVSATEPYGHINYSAQSIYGAKTFDALTGFTSGIRATNNIYLGAVNVAGDWLTRTVGSPKKYAIASYDDVMGDGSLFAYVDKFTIASTGHVTSRIFTTETDDFGSYFNITSLSSSQQTVLSLCSGTSRKWFISSRNLVDEPYDRLGFFYFNGSSYLEFMQILTNGDVIAPRCWSLKETSDSITPGDTYGSFYLNTSGVLRFAGRHGGVLTDKIVVLAP